MSALVPPRVLIADDYALSGGISHSIETLGAVRKISGTSAFTTFPRWREDARQLRELRGMLSVGLHLNLTVEAPLGALKSLAPAGTFPPLSGLVRAAVLRRIDAGEVRDEINRQLDAFEQAMGFSPDHVDGHQHVHVLPTVRGALLGELARRYRDQPPLVRDPTEALAHIAKRSPAKAKAMIVRGLAQGFATQARRHGLPVNAGFSGFSAFDTARPFRDEMIAALDRRHETAALKIVMCHPGFPDAELAARDPVTARRQQEHDTLLELEAPDAVIWHPSDSRSERPCPDWAALAAGKVVA